MPRLFLGPYAGSLAGRLGYRRAMIIADLGRMVLVALLAVILGPNTWPAIYVVTFLVTALESMFSPASTGLLPLLVNSPAERLAANAVLMQALALAGVIGSAIGGVVAGMGLITQLLIIQAATFGVSALSLWLVKSRTMPIEEGAPDEAEEAEEMKGGFVAGYKLIIRRPLLVFASLAMALPELASGAILVWIVPYSFHALHLGNGGVGYLFAALGIGALLGGVVAAVIGSAVRLDHLLAAGIICGGLALAVFGIWQVAAAAMLFLCLAGMAEAVEYAAYGTLLQQAIPQNLIGRVAGTIESFFFAMMLIGNLASGPVSSLIGLRASIAGLGLASSAVAIAAWLHLRAVTAGRPNALDLLRVPAFAAMPDSWREWAVRRMVREEFAPGAVLMRQGDDADRFYAITKGRAEVEVELDGSVETRRVGKGDFVGEIALLQNKPRTATVRAVEPMIAYALDRA
ncbi:MAG: hypothetical protein DLM70_08565, partial [Chloroflexi bacterium]